MRISIEQGDGTKTVITTDKVRVMWHNVSRVSLGDPEWWADEWKDEVKKEACHEVS